MDANAGTWRFGLGHAVSVLAADAVGLIGSFIVIGLLSIPGGGVGDSNIIFSVGYVVMAALIGGSLLAAYYPFRVKSERAYQVAVTLPLLPVLLPVAFLVLKSLVEPFF